MTKWIELQGELFNTDRMTRIDGNRSREIRIFYDTEEWEDFSYNTEEKKAAAYERLKKQLLEK